jgi:hypothetical protein
MVLGCCAPILVVTIRDDLGGGSGNRDGLQAQAIRCQRHCASRSYTRSRGYVWSGERGPNLARCTPRVNVSLRVGARVIERPGRLVPAPLAARAEKKIGGVNCRQ